MELRQYWNVIWRRRWLVLAIMVLTALFSAYSLFTAPRQYHAEAVFTVRQENATPPDPTKVFSYNDYYKYLSSEYLVDDYTQIIESDAFGQAVIDTIKKDLSSANAKPQIVVSDTAKVLSDVEKMKPKDITDDVGADRRHRELRVFAETPSRDLTKAIMDAAGIVLTQGLVKPYNGTDPDKPVFSQIDQVTYSDMTSNASKELTSAITRMIIGLVAALALVFLLEYLDNSVRDEKDARKVLDLPVIGAIPRV